MSGNTIFDDLRSRSLLYDYTDEKSLKDLLLAGPVTLYHGIDPTQSSLHVGNLVGVLLAKRFQQAGHRPLLLLGGATGLVGDPSGRTSERNLLDVETLNDNIAGLQSQLSGLIDFDGTNAARLVNNLDWTRSVTLIDFLRDIGKHVTVNQMLTKDSVRIRMAGSHGISFTEFTYMLFQAFDYQWLFKNFNCQLQVGGSDQWGNITAGIDLVRRLEGQAVHGLTWPLMTRADGTKFGKTVDGAVWLDPKRTLPYEFHQYFINTDDRDVQRLLLQLTLLPVSEIADIMANHSHEPHKRSAQGVLADEVCGLVHGHDTVKSVKLAAELLFGGTEFTGEALSAVQGVVPETKISSSIVDALEPLVDMLAFSGVCSSKSEARRTIQAGGIRVNGRRIRSADESVTPVVSRFLLLQRGRKLHHLFVLE
ncbi:MAG: tyrosine--tRNA ligase [Acidimicrobiaceae bacterium]|nr:tyrosine--tRNA ligase [Acidimicrobiaceae bacterium]